MAKGQTEKKGGAKVIPLKKQDQVERLPAQYDLFTGEARVLPILVDRDVDVTFRVEDSGIGMPPAQLGRIRDRILKMGESPDYILGDCLGLSLCHHLLRKMGGKLQIASREGRGSVFSFTIPLKTQAAGTDEHEAETQAESDPAPLPSVSAPIWVLYMTRNPGSGARHFLENLGYIRYRYFVSNLTGKDFDALDLLKSIGRKKGMQLSQEQWEHLAWLWYEPLTRVGQIELDLPETLTTLKRLGLKLGIVSNTFVNRSSLEKHLRAIGILDFFAMRMFSYEFECRKPDMEIFRIAAGKIGAAIENILFVGDRIDKDVQPALQTGMEAALKDAYTNEGKTTPPRAHRIRLLSELPALIESINAKASPHCSTGSLGAAR